MAPVAKPLQLSKFSLKLSKLMNPLHFQQRPLNQQRPATAEKWVSNGCHVSIQRVFNGYPLKTRSVAVPLPLGDFWRMEHLCPLWSTGVVCTKQGWRSSILYRLPLAQLKTIKNRYPLPLPEELFGRLGAPQSRTALILDPGIGRYRWGKRTSRR